MSAQISIRPATAADIPALSVLLGALFTQESEFHPNANAQTRGLSAILADPVIGTIFAACDGARIVGMVSLLFTISTALGARVALLEDLVVVDDMRAAGIGGQLMDHAISEAKALGIARITLLTDGPNLAAQRFYERHGYRRSHMTPFRLNLEK